MKILITDNVDNLLIELLENNSFILKAFDIERSDAIIHENFDGLIVRNRQKLMMNFYKKQKNLNL